MIRAVIFDMYETLVTVFEARPYYSAEMARDAGVPLDRFRQYWRSFEAERTLGRCGLEEALRGTLQPLGVYTPELLEQLRSKRLTDQARIFSAARPQIRSLLDGLRARGIRIGLVSNCYLEERDCIRAGALAGAFDAMMLSCEQGVAKPEPEIFRRCLAELGTAPEETLYVGDGGSMELEAALRCGMKAVQACWFINEEEPDQPCGRKPGFPHAETPEELLRMVDLENG